ncbi:MAG: hypothetical protein EXQ47_10750 [Bryobacterales bacterium]|nr:hypothetical protein [Bryobacterales bacterium]
MYHYALLSAFILFAAVPPLSAQRPSNWLERAFGGASGDSQPLLSPAAPEFSLLLASREVEIRRTADPNMAHLSIGDIPLRLELRHERQSAIDLYRIRHAAGSEIRAEQLRFTWTFPAAYNESMTFDAGALQGQPLYLPDGKIPDNQFTNWGSLFYNRDANVAVGVTLDGAEISRHARRGHSRFTNMSTLQLVAITGNPKMEITLFAYRPKDSKFWWAEWYQLRRGVDPNIPVNFFPILSAADLSWQPGERQTVAVIPGPEDNGRRMELCIIDEIGKKLAARVPFEYQLPVTTVKVPVGNWRSGLYRLVVVPAGGRVDPSENDLNQKLTNVIVRPARAQAQVLYVAATDMWLAYATNGGHDYHGWRTGYDGSVGYSPTVMSSRQHRLNNFFYSLYERFAEIHHWRYLDELAARDGFTIEYATQRDVALGRVRLEDYRLVLIGNHSEFTTKEGFLRFQEYLGRGGGVLLHGGDSFAVIVEYLPSLAEPRYFWQRGHVWAHLGDQPSDFQSPRLLPEDAPPDAPVLDPTTGSAIDYLNPFHTSVGYWIGSSKAVIADAAHRILSGLNLKAGDEVPGPWGGEVDFAYEPRAWDILVRSDRAAPEAREFGIQAFDPTPLHRIGIAVHKNERLGMICGENFPNILAGQGNTLFRELYRRTLHDLLARAKPNNRENVIPANQRDSTVITLNRSIRIDTLRYELPPFIDYRNPRWHVKPAPYAHYMVEGSIDGKHWIPLADRRHGPWRGVKTDTFPAVELRYLRFDGTFSNGETFHVRNVEAFPAN